MNTKRQKHGNMLVLIVAVILGIVVAIALFALGYARVMGSHAEQRTAIEAAALAAARDVSNIVINTPEFGYVGLSDSAPTGSTTNATDVLPTPVHSINTLLGTARLDLIIANELGVPEFEELALNDLAAAKARADALILIIEAAIAPTGNATDKNGQIVTPYLSAETAYQQNQIRMSGQSSYVPGSLQLSLGALEGGGPCNVPIPNPPGVDGSLSSSNTISGYYRSYTNIPYNGQDFVFAGIGDDAVRLVDTKKWRAALASLPYHHRTIIRAEAQQEITDPGMQRTHNMSAVACAQPASIYDPKPAPGALTVSFPDGMPTGPQTVPTLQSLYGAPFNTVNSDYYFGDTGDYPVDGGSQITDDTSGWPITSDSSQLASNACVIAVYDWIRRGGTKVNVVSLKGIHTTPFDVPPVATPPIPAQITWGPPPLGDIPNGIIHIHRIDTDGSVSYESRQMKPEPWYVVGHQQTMIESFDVITNGAPVLTVSGITLPSADFDWPNSTSNGQVTFTPGYDMFVRIYSRRRSKMTGGKHAGEPMDNPVTAFRDRTTRIADLAPGQTIFESIFRGRGAQGKKWWKKGDPGFNGAPPKLTARNDFPSLPGGTVDTSPGLYEKYDDVGPGPVRPSYRTNGTVADIRFRRVVQISDDASNSEFAYIGRR